MKNIIISIVLIVLTIITALTLFTLYSQNTRENELDESLSIAVEQSLDNLKINKSYDVNNTEEFIADFLENLLVLIESDSEIKVEVLSVDIDKGLLDVNVVETFKQPNGSTRTASCRKTIIMDEYVKAAPVYYSVQFLTNDKENSENFVAFKEYSIYNGSKIIVPTATPKREGYTFEGWSDTKPSTANSFSPEIVNADELQNKVVENNLVYYAVFKEA